MTNKLPRRIRSSAIAAGLALALGWGVPAYAADPIQFDADGTDANAATQTYGSFDWSVSTALLDGAIPVLPGVPTTFNIYTHAALGGFKNADGTTASNPANMNGTWEITAIAGFSETATVTGGSITLVDNQGALGGGDDVYRATSTISLTFNAAGSTNFFALYYDDVIGDGTKASELAGTGFDDGTLILSGMISAFTTPGSFSSEWFFRDANNNGLYDAGEESGINPDTGLSVNAGRRLDQLNPDDWAGQLTAFGNGSTSVEVDVTFQNNDFFKSLITALSQDLFFTTRNNLPIDDTNPSKSFDTSTGAGTLTLAGGGINLGSVNCVSGPDCLLETDASNSFVTTVPEPSSLALLGLTLVVLGVGRMASTRRSPV